MSKTTVSASAAALPSHSRRRFLAAGSTATVFAGLHAAGTAAAPSSLLLDLMAAHRAATIAFDLAREYSDAEVEIIGEVAAEANTQRSPHFQTIPKVSENTRFWRRSS
jgi:hypothetical protein